MSSRKICDTKKLLEYVGNTVGWLSVAAQLKDDIGTFASNPGYHPPKPTPCPFHGGSGNNFRLDFNFNRTGEMVCSCMGGRSGFWFEYTKDMSGYQYAKALKELIRISGYEDGKAKVKEANFETKEQIKARALAEYNLPKEVARRRGVQIKMWQEAKPWNHPDAKGMQLYFERRGLKIEDTHGLPNFRLHPGLNYRPQLGGKVLGKFPAILIPVMDSNKELLYLKRIFITHDGEKAPMPTGASDCKQAMPWIKRGLQHFGLLYQAPGSTKYDVGEGFELMFAVSLLRDSLSHNVISADNAAILPNVFIPGNATEVNVWVDKDVSGIGRTNAEALKSRLLKERPMVKVNLFETRETIPEGSKGVDWEDVIVSRGILDHPRWYRMSLLQATEKSLPLAA